MSGNENKYTTKEAGGGWGSYYTDAEMRAVQSYEICPLTTVVLPAQICPGAGIGAEKRYYRKKQFCLSQIVASLWPNHQALCTSLILPSSRMISKKGKFSFISTQDRILQLGIFC